MQRTLRFLWFGQVTGALGHILFYWVQENTYGEQNFLKFLSDALGKTVSATSYFVILGNTCLALILIYLFLRSEESSISGSLFTMALIFIPIAVAIVYTIYEMYQSQHPKYQDNHLLDATLGWVACLTVWILAILSYKPR
jgi:hypothetical protein